jgi:hypothetical protein
VLIHGNVIFLMDVFFLFFFSLSYLVLHFLSTTRTDNNGVQANTANNNKKNSVKNVKSLFSLSSDKKEMLVWFSGSFAVVCVLWRARPQQKMDAGKEGRRATAATLFLFSIRSNNSLFMD